MVLKRFSRTDILEHKVPLHAKFSYSERDSDHHWYYVFSNEEVQRLAKYYGIPLDDRRS